MKAPRILTARHLTTASGRGSWPAAREPELAFLGRSNVGKSSLINRLVGRRQLARTSSTPGKTRQLNFFELELAGGRTVRLVDLPGYGYARVSRAERARWRPLVEDYLAGRETLCAAVLLQDVRRDVGEDELDLLAWLAEHGVPALVAVTKTDKLKRGARSQRLRSLREAISLPAECVIATSATTGDGIAQLWSALWQCVCSARLQATASE